MNKFAHLMIKKKSFGRFVRAFIILNILQLFPSNQRREGDLFCEQKYLRTFALKSSYGEIFFISPLELVDKVLTPKMKKENGGHRLCFGENGSGKMP